MIQKKYYSSKLLLFGEHTVTLGGQALAIPYPNYHSFWSNCTSKADETALKKALAEFVDLLEVYRKDGKINFEVQIGALRNKIKNNYFFDTNIPIGYGLGSSGTVCAAIYDSYVSESHKKDKSIGATQKDLAQLENIFHGNSSGIDPLVCYLNKGIYLGKNGIKLLQTVPSLSSENFHSFLIDTKIKRNTASLVNYFRRRSSEEDFYKNCTRVLLELSREIIQLYIDEKHLELLVLLHEVSELQLNYMKKMIPMTFHQIWEEGLTSNLYSLKLCGAGGGGFILGFTANWEKTKAQLKGYSIEKIVL